MNNTPSQPRIIFMGTPDFAVPSLEKLINSGFEIVAVVTAPGKPAGRGLKIQESAVKKFTDQKGLKILQPEKLKDPQFLKELKNLNADLNIVVAFRMLPESVWNMPRLGTINLHASLLPQYRGAAPINWVIINGEKETGLTTFKLKHEIDTGNILFQEKIAIDATETAGELHDRMKLIGADLVLKTVQELIQGNVKETIQAEYKNNQPLKLAPKLFTEQSRIDWNRPSGEIFNLIRGLSPYPGAFTLLNNKILKIYKAEKEITVPYIKPGEYLSDQKLFLKFAAQDGYISINELQLEGKKRMSVDEFLRGNKV